MIGHQHFSSRISLVGDPNPVIFTPATVNGIRLWLDFGDPNTLYTDAGTSKVSSDGDLIYQANDKSGNGFHAVMATEADRPAYKTNVQNGKSVSRYNQDVMVASFGGLVLNQPNTIFFVHKNTIPEGTSCYLFTGILSANRNQLLVFTTPNPDAWNMHAGAFLNGGVMIKNTPCIVCAVFNQDNSFLYVNNSEILTGPVGANGLDGLTIMASNSLGARTDGDVMEVIVYNAALSSADRIAVNNYLNSKWNIY